MNIFSKDPQKSNSGLACIHLLLCVRDHGVLLPPPKVRQRETRHRFCKQSCKPAPWQQDQEVQKLLQVSQVHGMIFALNSACRQDSILLAGEAKPQDMFHYCMQATGWYVGEEV